MTRWRGPGFAFAARRDFRIRKPVAEKTDRSVEKEDWGLG